MRDVRTHVYSRIFAVGRLNSFLPSHARFPVAAGRFRNYNGLWKAVWPRRRRWFVIQGEGERGAFRTRWKIYGGPVDKLCFISRDVIFIKAAGRCLLPPYTPGSRVVVSRLYMCVTACTSVKYTMLFRIYEAIYQYTDACIPDKRHADGSLERVKIDLCREKRLSRVCALVLYTLPN